MVCVLGQIPGQLLSIPLSVITGCLAKSCGPLDDPVVLCADEFWGPGLS